MGTFGDPGWFVLPSRGWAGRHLEQAGWVWVETHKPPKRSPGRAEGRAGAPGGANGSPVLCASEGPPHRSQTWRPGFGPRRLQGRAALVRTPLVLHHNCATRGKVSASQCLCFFSALMRLE